MPLLAPQDTALYASLHALVIEDMLPVRQELTRQLQQLGVIYTEQAANANEALTALEKHHFDLVLCDYHLGDATNGQHLLEHARGRGLLTRATAFVMVTAEGGRASVAATSDCQPDDYLLKPFTINRLAARLGALMKRQVAFKLANERQRAGDLAGVIQACEPLADPQGKYRIDALRRIAESHLALGHHEAARGCWEQILALGPELLWARVGHARSLKAAGEVAQARAAALRLIEGHPRFVPAYDLLADCIEATGDDRAALRVLRASVEIVPSARRSRRVGETAYRAGDLACAREHFASALRLTRGARTADPMDALQLAQVHVETGQPDEALALLARCRAALPASLAAAHTALLAQAHAGCGDHAKAAELVAQCDALGGAAAPRADTATVMLAKGYLAVGRQDEAVGLLAAAVRADHENHRVASLVRGALRTAGLERLADTVVEDAVRQAGAVAQEANALMRRLQFDQARVRVEEALQALPDNTGVLLAASQVTLLWMARQPRLDEAALAKVERYLERLDALLPGHERVAQQRRFCRETVAKLREAMAA